VKKPSPVWNLCQEPNADYRKWFIVYLNFPLSGEVYLCRFPSLASAINFAIGARMQITSISLS